MSAQIIDGKGIAKELRAELRQDVDASVDKGNRQPGLAVVLVGSDPASQVYVRNKRKACEEVGIKSFAYDLPETTSQEELDKIIDDLNNNDEVDGILVQFPLPKHLDESSLLKRSVLQKMQTVSTLTTQVDQYREFLISVLAHHTVL